jgi:hypothetical protein
LEPADGLVGLDELNEAAKSFLVYSEKPLTSVLVYSTTPRTARSTMRVSWSHVE